MQQCTSEDLFDVILPRLVQSLSLWRYLSARVEVMSSSSTATNSPTAVSGSAAAQSIDIAKMLCEYATLQQCVRSFCDDLLEKETQPVDIPDKACEQLLEKDADSSHAVSNTSNCQPQSDSVTCVEALSVPATDVMENTVRTDVPSSEIPTTNSSVAENCLATVSSDRNRPLNCESLPLSSGILTIDGNTNVGNSSASDADLNPGIVKVCESNSCLRALSEISSEMTETNAVSTYAVKTSESSAVVNEDYCKVSCSNPVMNGDVSNVNEENKTSTVESSVESCSADREVQSSADMATPGSVDTGTCSADTSDTSNPAVTVTDNTLEVSNHYAVQ